MVKIYGKYMVHMNHYCTIWNWIFFVYLSINVKMVINIDKHVTLATLSLGFFRVQLWRPTASGSWYSRSIHDRDRKLGDGSSDLGIFGINQLTHGLPKTSMLWAPTYWVGNPETPWTTKKRFATYSPPKKNCRLWHIVEAFVIGDFTHHHSDFAILPMLDRDVEFVVAVGNIQEVCSGWGSALPTHQEDDITF